MGVNGSVHAESGWSGNRGRYSGRHSWKKRAGWWCEYPAQQLASVYVTCIPAPSVTVCIESKPVLTARGDDATGIHAVARDDSGSLQQFASIVSKEVTAVEAQAWASSVPEGALVLLAVVGPPTSHVEEVLTAFKDGGIRGAPQGLPTSDCSAAAAVGRKGASGWRNVAAADFALVTLQMGS